FPKIPGDVVRRTKIFWLCYPNSPTGKLATKELYEEAIAFCQKHDIILASDECYVDIYSKEKPISALEISKRNVVAFHSLSKRNNMTGYRVGFVCGDPDVIAEFKKLKTNIDSGTPNFTQAAAIAALRDEDHVELMRNKYRKRMTIITDALRRLGLASNESEGTFYLWQRVPEGFDSISFAKRLLEPDCGIAVTPGKWLSDVTADGVNPGEFYVRFALVERENRVAEAARRLSNLKL
ncbi:MAG: aminotransferase class I/II-fold pyridoxal phosphate-dependent enzyme, partial [Patescibacteria group bacterium]